MYPVLFKLGKLTIHTYGFFIALGFLVGITLAKKEALRMGESDERIVDLCFFILVFSIIGSRIFYMMTNFKVFLSDPLETFRIWKGGLVFYGGFIGALLTVIIYVKMYNMHLWKITDILAPPLAIGHLFGRIGCFFAGCCYGKTCDLPWAVTFTRDDSLAPTGVPLHPTQLYEAFNNFAIFTFLWLFRRHKQYDGQVFWLYVFFYGITRSILEVFRNDFRGGFVFGILSISQVIGGTLSITAVFMLIFMSGKKNKLKSIQ